MGQREVTEAMEIGFLLGLKTAAGVTALSDVPTSCAYASAREVWRRYWGEHDRLVRNGWKNLP